MTATLQPRSSVTATKVRRKGRPESLRSNLPLSNGSGSSSHKFRGDIQGLRAVAVIAVIMDHLWSWPSGGFVGVDIFFVISGYLITDLLLREKEKTGRISYLGFYRRRIRRIIPLALLVLAGTVGASYIVYQTVRANIIRVDAQWALGFLANWHFAAEKTDYFNNENLVSPLQHFWSLSVEEQFYVVWPIALIGLALLAWNSRFRRAIIASTLVVIVIASFDIGWMQTTSEPTVAYFSTPTRVWELGIGALLAVMQPHLKRLPRCMGRILSWLGLAGIAVSLVLISSSSRFPVPWGALPIVAAALVIAGGCGMDAYRNPVLDNFAGRYIGDLSYSLYLWHFPMIVLITALVPQGDILRSVIIVAITAVISVLSFHLVEDPVRHSNWLEARSSAKSKVRYRDGFDATAARGVKWSVVSLAMGTTLLLAGLAVDRTGQLARAEVDQINSVVDVKQPNRVTEARDSIGLSAPKTFESKLQVQITNALRADTFPSLLPSIDQLPNNKAPQWAANGCGTTGPWNAKLCTYGPKDATKSVAVIGDSIALSWLPGLIKAFGPNGYRIHSFVSGACPAANVKVGHDSAGEANCEKHRSWALSAIADLKPIRIVLADASFLVPMLSDGATGADAVAEWETGLRQTLDRLTTVAPVTVLSSPPGSQSLLDCATRTARPRNCEMPRRNGNSSALGEAERAATGALAVKFVDATNWFCDLTRCPSFVGTTPVYVDGHHLTRQYSQYLAPALTKALNISR